MNCGLLGKSLSHSYSPQIHKFLGNYSYELFEKKPEELSDFLQNGDFSAINVTIPYKKDVIPYCSQLTDCAKKMGAVNTIIRKDDGSLLGHNTDYFGFRSAVLRMGLTLQGKKALVLGSGGASASAVVVLKELGAYVVVISRSGENNYDNIHRHKDASFIVNATPVGMYPDTGICPIDLDLFPNLEGVMDMIYNPLRTQLLMEAEKRNIPCQNGLWMLVAQAKEAAQWFTGKKIRDNIIGELHDRLVRQTENIILIGMPGCGKSTVGKLLSDTLQRPFVDADSEIERKAQLSIKEIFERYGESSFRKLETDVLADLGRRSGLIIATGGGCVTREENYPHLHQNGTIYWLQRDIAVLPIDGRPLSQGGHLEEMYRVRKPLYESFADDIIINDGNLTKTLHRLLKG